MKRLVIAISVLLIAVLATLLIAPSLIDWNGYRGELERQASRFFNRPVRVGGKVSLQLLPTPYLSIADVRIAGDDGRFSRPFLKIGALTIRLSVPPLLKGEIEASEVSIEEPELQLAINAEGHGNWRDFGASASAMSLLPKSVALSSVRIERGQVRFVSASAGELWTIGAINGELAAPALVGPYRFKGSFASGSERQELRLSTGVLNDPAGAQLKIATTRPAPAADSLSFDGIVSGLDTVPKLKGSVSGVLRSLASTGSAATLLSRPIELAAKVDGDISGARLTEIVATIAPSPADDAAPPQRTQEVRGSAAATWEKGGEWTVDLSTQWVDLERLLPTTALANPSPSAAAGPWERLIPTLEPVIASLPSAARFHLRGSAETAELLGGQLQNFQIALSRDNNVLTLDGLSAVLPGLSQVEMSGRLARFGPPDANGEAVAFDFDGPIRLQGANPHRLLAWIGAAGLPNGQSPTGAVDRPFLIDGRFAWSADAASADDVRAEIAGNAVSGHWRSRKGPDASIDLALDTDLLDLRGLWDAPDTAVQWRNLLVDTTKQMASFRLAAQPEGKINTPPATPSLSASSAQPSTKPPVSETLASVKINLRIGRLLTDTSNWRDIDLVAAQSGSVCLVDHFALHSDQGFAIDGRGSLKGSAEAGDAALNFSLAVEQPAALAAVLAFFPLAPTQPSPELLATLLPLKVAGTYAVGRDPSGQAELAIDGLAAGGRIFLSQRGFALFDPSAATTAPISLTAELSQPHAIKLLEQVRLATGLRQVPVETALDRVESRATGAGEVSQSDLVAAESPPGTLRLRLEGSLAGGMHAIATLDTGSDRGVLNSIIRQETGTTEWTLAGNAELRGDTPDFWARSLGLPAQFDWPKQPLVATVDIARNPRDWHLTAGRLRIGDQAATFDLTVAGSSESPPRPYDLTIATAGFDASAATAFVLQSSNTSAPAAETPMSTVGLTAAVPGAADAAVALADPTAKPSYDVIWSTRPFDFGRFELPGRIRLAADTLTLAPGFLVRGAKLDVNVSREGLAVAAFEGEALGGNLAATGALRKQAAGAELNLSAKLTDLDLEEIAGTLTTEGQSIPQALGKANITVDATGKGLDPQGLVGLLNGSGTIQVAGGAINDVSPLAVDAAAKAVLTDRARLEPQMLQQLMTRGRLLDQFPLNKSEAAFTIRDGRLTTDPLRFEAAASILTISTGVDLQTARLSSVWSHSPKSYGDSRMTLPAVTFSYGGRLDQLSRLTPEIDVTALEKELMARRLLGGEEMLGGLWPDQPTVRTLPPTAPLPQTRSPSASPLVTRKSPAGTAAEPPFVSEEAPLDWSTHTTE